MYGPTLAQGDHGLAMLMASTDSQNEEIPAKFSSLGSAVRTNTDAVASPLCRIVSLSKSAMVPLFTAKIPGVFSRGGPTLREHYQ